MPSRTFHHKSRHGCFACKQRRRKCDERRPVCSACARRRSVCVYDQSSDSVAAMEPFSRPIIRTLATEWATIEPSIQAILLLQIPHVGFGDVKMISHFKTQGRTTLDTMPGIFGVRNLNLVKRVPEYPYLLYGLLTASALHSKSSVPPGNESSCLLLEEKAANFYQLALSSYRSRLDVIDEHTCHSIFAFSVTLAGLTFGLLHPKNANRLGYYQTYINGIIDVFDLLLGAVAIAHESRAWIPDSLAEEPLMLPIRRCLSDQSDSTKGEANSILDVLPSEIHSAYALECSSNPQSMSVDISVVYECVIPELHNVFACLQQSEPNNILGVIGWPAFVGKPFVSLLKQQNPAALVVLAHYGVALQALNCVWWLRDIGSRVIQEVAEVVAGQYSDKWQKLLWWPMEKLKHPKLSASANYSAHMGLSSYSQKEGKYLGNAKPFEMALVITQIKGITGPYYTSSSHGRRAI